MKSSIIKRSVIVDGHKTSVSLEAPFWDGLKDIAALRHEPLSVLLHAIDGERENTNLSSAIRVFVLTYFRDAAGGARGKGGRASSAFLADDSATLS